MHQPQDEIAALDELLYILHQLRPVAKMPDPRLALSGLGFLVALQRDPKNLVTEPVLATLKTIVELWLGEHHSPPAGAAADYLAKAGEHARRLHRGNSPADTNG